MIKFRNLIKLQGTCGRRNREKISQQWVESKLDKELLFVCRRHMLNFINLTTKLHKHHHHHHLHKNLLCTPANFHISNTNEEGGFAPDKKLFKKIQQILVEIKISIYRSIFGTQSEKKNIIKKSKSPKKSMKWCRHTTFLASDFFQKKFFLNNCNSKREHFRVLYYKTKSS